MGKENVMLCDYLPEVLFPDILPASVSLLTFSRGFTASSSANNFWILVSHPE